MQFPGIFSNRLSEWCIIVKWKENTTRILGKNLKGVASNCPQPSPNFAESHFPAITVANHLGYASSFPYLYLNFAAFFEKQLSLSLDGEILNTDFRLATYSHMEMGQDL